MGKAKMNCRRMKKNVATRCAVVVVRVAINIVAINIVAINIVAINMRHQHAPST
ncbi:hypothetical protein E4U15_007568 [Claviceps sp. LM218 group G6]|nr:hypothetical protein E4U15_007568 [Claviceps sp. LM218 group G6]